MTTLYTTDAELRKLREISDNVRGATKSVPRLAFMHLLMDHANLVAACEEGGVKVAVQKKGQNDA